jgi:uncharacterized protein YyaL (SSP411 family)
MKSHSSQPSGNPLISFQILLGTFVLVSSTIFLGVHAMKKDRVEAATPSEDMNPTNHLSGETSPYLLQHVHNPVDWYPWGEEAFEKARKEDKMIFLSIGYSTCHWCHVMAHESFENADIAKVMNEYFVCVKVDREERPDVDKVYMAFVQATTGGGGWPMSVWLTPDLKPVVGGTYFPPEQRSGLPGFPDVCKQIASAWNDDPQRLIDSGNEVVKRLREIYTAKPGGSEALTSSVLDLAYTRIESGFDEENKGFGRAPKFPRPVNFNFLLRYMSRKGRETDVGTRALSMTLESLDAIAEGGIHDHLGGGFHRYAVDQYWHVPHFEKMLYDQAQLAVSYLEAYQITRDKRYADVARDVLDYVLRDMTSSEGGFYSAEDADSLLEHGKKDHAEGAFYVWTSHEIEQALGKEHAGWFNVMYGVQPGGNAPIGSDPHGEFKGENILIQRKTSAEIAEQFGVDPEKVRKAMQDARATLKGIRDKRPRPHLDDKVIVAWNGLMLSAFSKAGQVLPDGDRYTQAAVKAASFIRDRLFDSSGGKLYRVFRGERSEIEGFLDDYAFLVRGLLDLYETIFDIQWIEWAASLQSIQDRLFWDADQGGYFATGGISNDILLRMKDDYDGAEPSANSIALMNLVRLHQVLGKADLVQKVDYGFKLFAEKMRKQPSAMPQMMVALDAHLHPFKQIVFAAGADDPGLKPMHQLVNQQFIPCKIVLLADGGKGQAFLGRHQSFMESVNPIGGRTTAFVCEHFVCQQPTTELDVFANLLNR